MFRADNQVTRRRWLLQQFVTTSASRPWFGSVCGLTQAVADFGRDRCVARTIAKTRSRKRMEVAMQSGAGTRPLPILQVTRLSFQLGILLATVAGIQLSVLSTRTADFFAWTIGVPMTAAFLGAFFWANTPGFVLAIRVGD